MYLDDTRSPADTLRQHQQTAARLANAPRDKPQVLVQADELSEALLRLEQTAEALDEQLNTVKNPGRAKEGSVGPGQPIQALSPLSESLLCLTMRVHALQLRLSTLRDTIEV